MSDKKVEEEEVDCSDKWTTQELLTLVSAVSRHGDKNWATIGRAFRVLPLDHNLSFERYSSKKCAEQYAQLAKIVDDAELFFESVEKQAEYLTEKMVEIHLQELQYSLQQTNNIFGQVQSFLEQVENGEFEDYGEEILDIINESDSAYDDMYRAWISYCNTGSITGHLRPPSIFTKGKASTSATSAEDLSENLPDFATIKEESSEAEAVSSASASESTSQVSAEAIESIAGPSSEKQASSIDTASPATPRAEPSIQPFFNPDNLLKSASSGLFPFSAGSSSQGAILKHPNLDMSSSQKNSTVSSVTLSAPTLSKLLEMPPSVPGKLPPLPTFHIKTEPLSPHKTLVKQLETASPLTQIKGLELPSASAGASPQRDNSKAAAGSCLAAYINKEISQLTKCKVESTAIEISKNMVSVNTDSNVIAEPETSSGKLLDNSQPQQSEKVIELCSEKKKEPQTIESTSSSEQPSIDLKEQNKAQLKKCNPELEVSNESFTEMEVDQPKEELMESSQSTSSNKESNVSETPQSLVDTEKSSALLKLGSSVSTSVGTLELEGNRGETSFVTKPAIPASESITKTQTLEDSTISKNINTSNSESQSCEFSFEEITFPIRKTTNEPTHSTVTSQPGHRTPIKRKRDSTEILPSSAVSGTGENFKDTFEMITRPKKLPKIEETSSTEMPSKMISSSSRSEKNSDKNKTDGKSYIAFQVHDQSVDAEVELKDKNERLQLLKESSSKTEVYGDTSTSFTPDITKIKQEILDPDEVENIPIGVCITDLTADRNQELQKIKNLPFSNSEVSSSSSSLHSTISEDTVATGNSTSHSESPASYQVSKDVKAANSSSCQDSMVINVPEVVIKKEIKQEILDSELESDTIHSECHAFTPFSCVSTPDSVTEIEQRKDSASSTVIKVEDCDSEESPFPTPRRGRRSCRTQQKSKEASQKSTSHDQSKASKETSRTELTSVSRTRSGGDVSQIEIEDVKPVRRGRPRRSKALDKSNENNEKAQEDSSVDNDFSNKKLSQVTIKQEKNETRNSRNNPAGVDRDDESTTSSQDSERFIFGNQRNTQKGSESRDKSDVEELLEKKNSEFSDDGENSLLKNISSAKPSPGSTPVSESSLAKGKEGKGRWSPQSMDRTSRSTIVTPTTSDISDDTSDDSDNSADTSTKQSKLKWNDLDSLHKYKTWKKSISIVWREAANHKYANVFAQKVTDDVAPGYHGVVTRPMDLSTIKKNIDNGTIKTTNEFQRDMMLMFNNAIMYNNLDHDVHNMALQMQKDVHKQIQDYLATQLIIQDKNKEPIVTSLRTVRQSKTQVKTSNRY